MISQLCYKRYSPLFPFLYKKKIIIIFLRPVIIATCKCFVYKLFFFASWQEMSIKYILINCPHILHHIILIKKICFLNWTNYFGTLVEILRELIAEIFIELFQDILVSLDTLLFTISRSKTTENWTKILKSDFKINQLWLRLLKDQAKAAKKWQLTFYLSIFLKTDSFQMFN